MWDLANVRSSRYKVASTRTRDQFSVGLNHLSLENLKHQYHLKYENPKQQQKTRLCEAKILLHNSALRRTHVWDLATERCSRYKVASTWIIGPVVCWSPPLVARESDSKKIKYQNPKKTTEGWNSYFFSQQLSHWAQQHRINTDILGEILIIAAH